jgi:hypothetical protein
MFREASNEDLLFSAKLQIFEEISKISLMDDVIVSGLDAEAASEIPEPFIRIDKLTKPALDNLDLYVNGYRLVSPDSIAVEKFLSPAADKSEHTLSLTAFWENENLTPERRSLKYWIGDTKKPALARGNPDGTISLTVPSEETRSVLELLTIVQSGDISVTEAKMLFQSENLSGVKKIAGKIRSLCGFKNPVETGEWKWRSSDGVDKKAVKSVIDGGIVKWYGFSDWNGTSLVGGSAVAWNGLVSSAELVVAGEENSERILETLRVLPLDDGFSLSVVEESPNITKIAITDHFVINFSSLWGI